MDPVDNERATAKEMVSYARQQGVDLEPVRKDSILQKGQRWIFLWGKREALPCSGPADEPEGTLHYNMQGAISVLPSSLKGAAGTFQGAWSEAGTFESMDQAFDLVKAWLLDSREVEIYLPDPSGVMGFEAWRGRSPERARASSQYHAS
jgi:hypothetical protein